MDREMMERCTYVCMDGWMDYYLSEPFVSERACRSFHLIIQSVKIVQRMTGSKKGMPRKAYIWLRSQKYRCENTQGAFGHKQLPLYVHPLMELNTLIEVDRWTHKET